MGLHGSDTAEIALDDVVAAPRLDARRDRRRLQGRDDARSTPGATPSPPAASGSARAALDESVAYATGAQAVRPPDRRLPARAGDARRHEGRAPTPRGCSSSAPARLKDAGQPNTTETSIAKFFATEAAVWCANTAIQVHGGAGYVDDHPVERYFRDVRVTTLYEGTSQIQKLIIGRALTGTTRSSRSRRARDVRVTPAAAVVGVVGAGTMGAGIAQLALRDRRADAPATTRCPAPPSAARPRSQAGLAKAAERGRLSAARRDAARAARAARRRSARSRRCELVIEAAPERLELKRELFARARARSSPRLRARVEHLLDPDHRDRGAVPSGPSASSGMHFFNPAPVMRLVEVIAGVQTGEAALALARATGEAMGKRVIDAADGPGFLVNRCNRPFGLEALRAAAGADRRRRARSTASCASAAAFAWARSSSRTSSGSTPASRSRKLVLRAELRRAALAPVAAERADGRRGPPRPQDRPRLVRLRATARSTATRTRPRPSRGGGDGRSS